MDDEYDIVVPLHVKKTIRGKFVPEGMSDLAKFEALFKEVGLEYRLGNDSSSDGKWELTQYHLELMDMEGDFYFDKEGKVIK